MLTNYLKCRRKPFPGLFMFNFVLLTLGRCYTAYTGSFRKNLPLVKTKLFKNQKFDGLLRDFRKHRKNFNLRNMNHINLTKIIQ